MYLEQGKELKSLRQSKNLTIPKVAKYVGVSINCISLIELGKRKPSDIILYKMAEFYGVNPMELCSLYGYITTDQLERYVSSPALVKLFASLSVDDRFTEEEKKELYETIEKEVENILKKRGN